MQILLRILALVGLGLMFVPVLLYCGGRLEHDTLKQVLMWGTVLWFAAMLPLRFRRDVAP